MSVSIPFGAWLGNRSVVQMQIPLRASIEWARILDNPVDIQLVRRGEVMDLVQTVRIEFEDSFTNNDSELGMGSLRKGTIHGLHGHPDYDDLDVMVADVLIYDDKEFTITFVNHLDYCTKADFEVTG